MNNRGRFEFLVELQRGLKGVDHVLILGLLFKFLNSIWIIRLILSHLAEAER